MLMMVRRRVELAVDEHRPTDYILLRGEAPKAAVEADVTIIAHSEVAIGRNNQIVPLDVLRQRQLPGWGHVIEIGGRHCREIVAIGIVFAAAVNDVRFIQLFTIAVDGAVTQVNAVTGDSNDALHDIKPRLSGRKKDDDVAVVDLTIRQQGTYPIRARRERSEERRVGKGGRGE